jgi:uncharacterized protein YegL
MRRLPVYILIDISSSMRGEPIEAVKAGISTLLDSLNQDPYALETVCLSIITYNSKAEQILPLTEVYKLQVPELVAKGRSAMGEALLLLSERVDKEVVKNTPEQKGDWKPLLFLLSDGGYSGPIAKPIEEFKKRNFAMVVACAAGDKSHLDVLRKITNNVVKISTTESLNVIAYFKWISSSISTTSTRIEKSGNDDVIMQELPPLPQEIQMLHSFDK